MMTEFVKGGFSMQDVAIHQPRVYVGLPRKGACFRIHPDADRTTNGYVYFGRDKQWYLLKSELVEREHLEGKILGLYRGQLFQGVDRQGGSLIVVVSTSGDPVVSGALLAVMEQAKTAWYERQVVQYAFIPRPEIDDLPRWPAQTLEALLNDAFEDRYLATLEHPVLAAAKGCSTAVGGVGLGR